MLTGELITDNCAGPFIVETYYDEVGEAIQLYYDYNGFLKLEDMIPLDDEVLSAYREVYYNIYMIYEKYVAMIQNTMDHSTEE